MNSAVTSKTPALADDDLIVSSFPDLSQVRSMDLRTLATGAVLREVMVEVLAGVEAEGRAAFSSVMPQANFSSMMPAPRAAFSSVMPRAAFSSVMPQAQGDSAS